MPLAEQFDGTAFTPVPTATVAGEGYGILSSISCADGACMAVGTVEIGGDYVPLAERFDGSTWTLESLPSLASGSDVELLGVSCSSGTSCVAVGYYDGTCNFEAICHYPVAASFDGSGWTSSVPPAPFEYYATEGDAINVLSSISCVSSTDCTAVGYYSGDISNGTDYQEQENALIETFDGSSWAVEPNPDEGSFASYATLSGVACVPAGT
jgi:hypothetical protein